MLEEETMIITETREKMLSKEEEDLKVGLEEEASTKKEVNLEVTKEREEEEEEVEEEAKIDCEIMMILSHRKHKFD